MPLTEKLVWRNMYLIHISYKFNLQSLEVVFSFLHKKILVKVYPIVED